jgi:hypothetical protein
MSESVTGQWDGFEGMSVEVTLGQVGIIVTLEVSRLARDNAACYRMAVRFHLSRVASYAPHAQDRLDPTKGHIPD